MAADALSLPRAELAALFVESLLYGTSVIFYCISVWFLAYRQRSRVLSRVKKWMIATATAMMLLATVHLGIDVQRALDGFVDLNNTPTGTVDFYSQLNHPTHVGKTVIYVLQTLVGDAFVIYRLYVVYNRMLWVIFLPIGLLLGTGVAGFGVCDELTKAIGLDAIFAGTLSPWITSFFLLSLCTNVIVTILITGRIIWSNRRLQKYRAGAAVMTHGGVVVTIIESAAIYSAALISLIVTYLAGSNAQYICLDALQPLIGIVFALIIIRVGLNETPDSSARSHGQYSVRAGPSAGLPGRNSSAQVLSHQGEQFTPMKPMAISVSVSKMNDRVSYDTYPQKPKAVGTGVDDGSFIDIEDAPVRRMA